jgi:hypothetical protein
MGAAGWRGTGSMAENPAHDFSENAHCLLPMDVEIVWSSCLLGFSNADRPQNLAARTLLANAALRFWIEA